MEILANMAKGFWQRQVLAQTFLSKLCLPFFSPYGIKVIYTHGCKHSVHCEMKVSGNFTLVSQSKSSQLCHCTTELFPPAATKLQRAPRRSMEGCPHPQPLWLLGLPQGHTHRAAAASGHAPRWTASAGLGTAGDSRDRLRDRLQDPPTPQLHTGPDTSCLPTPGRELS